MAETKSDNLSNPNNQSNYDLAVSKGLEIIGSGGSKADAAKAIFELLQTEAREVVIQAFIVGAQLTPKGAPTYFYNTAKFFRKQKRTKSK